MTKKKTTAVTIPTVVNTENEIVDFENPWGYQSLSHEGRKAFDTELAGLELLVRQARGVRDFIVDEEYWRTTDGPKRNIMASVYSQRLTAGLITTRPAESVPELLPETSNEVVEIPADHIDV